VVAAQAETPLPELPCVDDLTLDSDFSGFLHPKVDPGVRKAALQKLFSDPHFNVMDGLDTYIDDYSKTEPLPPAMLAGLRQAQNILAWAQETKEETAARFAPPPATASTPLPVGSVESPEASVQMSVAEQPIQAAPITLESPVAETAADVPAISVERKS
jgi:hypothetical protein